MLRLAAALAALLGCVLPDDDLDDVPVEPMGAYLFTGTLDANSCGSTAVPALDPIEFRAELMTQAERAAWRLDRGPIIYGVVRADGSWRFETSQLIPVYDADPALGTAGCALVQVESVFLDEVPSLPEQGDGGMADPVMIEGRSTVTLSPAPQGDCRPSLAIYGGPFLQLPCTLEYSLLAELDAR